MKKKLLTKGKQRKEKLFFQLTTFFLPNRADTKHIKNKERANFEAFECFIATVCQSFYARMEQKKMNRIGCEGQMAADNRFEGEKKLFLACGVIQLPCKCLSH